MLTIMINSFRFQGEHHFIFTMDIKPLYTVIPNDEGLRAVKYFLDKGEVMDPPTLTHYYVWLVFNDEHYKQLNGVAMGQ